LAGTDDCVPDVALADGSGRGTFSLGGRFSLNAASEMRVIRKVTKIADPTTGAHDPSRGRGGSGCDGGWGTVVSVMIRACYDIT